MHESTQTCCSDQTSEWGRNLIEVIVDARRGGLSLSETFKHTTVCRAQIKKTVRVVKNWRRFEATQTRTSDEYFHITLNRCHKEFRLF